MLAHRLRLWHNIVQPLGERVKFAVSCNHLVNASVGQVICHLPKVDLMLSNRLRRWSNIISTSGQSLVFSVMYVYYVQQTRDIKLMSGYQFSTLDQH